LLFGDQALESRDRRAPGIIAAPSGNEDEGNDFANARQHRGTDIAARSSIANIGRTDVLPSPIEAGQNPNGKRAKEDDGARPFDEGDGSYRRPRARRNTWFGHLIGRELADEGGFFDILPQSVWQSRPVMRMMTMAKK
jgi:hypothetical protein